jgi:hypothetical protein
MPDSPPPRRPTLSTRPTFASDNNDFTAAHKRTTTPLSAEYAVDGSHPDDTVQLRVIDIHARATPTAAVYLTLFDQQSATICRAFWDNSIDTLQAAVDPPNALKLGVTLTISGVHWRGGLLLLDKPTERVGVSTVSPLFLSFGEIDALTTALRDPSSKRYVRVDVIGKFTKLDRFTRPASDAATRYVRRGELTSILDEDRTSRLRSIRISFWDDDAAGVDALVGDAGQDRIAIMQGLVLQIPPLNSAYPAVELSNGFDKNQPHLPISIRSYADEHDPSIAARLASIRANVNRRNTRWHFFAYIRPNADSDSARMKRAGTSVPQ